MRCEIFVSIFIPDSTFHSCADIIDSESQAFQIFLDIFLRAKSGVVSAQRYARLGGRICHKAIIAILAESGREFQFWAAGVHGYHWESGT
jgi:hypothetical protein